ncbi:MAG: AmpG family muropeptide MFS transporter [Rhodospirillaceae bacterium]|nr:AmpG family muropeptide MFS transporter [Rhodospirillaceae bacterium]
MPVSAHRSWRAAFATYGEKSALALLFLGFSAGLPFLLVFSTLSLWLRDVGVSRTAIGFVSWIGITYSIKVIWAPVIDHVPLIGLSGRLGRRRAWMFLAIAGIGLGLLGMACVNPSVSPGLLVGFALFVAFCSATQDVAIDAYRIEIGSPEMQGALTASYQLGYRIALLVAGAGALYIAEFQSWSVSYVVMAGLMMVGLITVLIIPEPESKSDRDNLTEGPPTICEWFERAVVQPFSEFFRRVGRFAIPILLFVGVYRVSDISMGVMANPFYIDLGFNKAEIAYITKIFGFGMTILGTFFGGVLVARYGVMGPLLLGATLIVLANLLFVLLAWVGRDLILLAAVISADNISGGLAGCAFIAYLSSLTRTPYTATQYAMFSSLMTLPGKLIGGVSGVVVDGSGYMIFFFYAATLGLPAIFLCLYLMVRQVAPEKRT